MRERKQKDIANDLDVSYAAVRKIISRYKTSGTYEIKPRVGRPKKLTKRETRTIIRVFRENRRITLAEAVALLSKDYNIMISVHTLRDILKFHDVNSYVAIRKPFISPKNKIQRKKWAKEHVNWNINEWKRIVWSDECHVESDNRGRVRVWRKSNEKYHESCLVGTIKSGRFSVTVWGCIGWNGVGPIRIIDGRLNAAKYVELLSDVKEELEKKFGKSYYFQDDNAPIHRASIVNQWKEQNNIKSLQWVSQSPDLNIIENVWSKLKHGLSKIGKLPNDVNSLKKDIAEVYSSIQVSYIRSLIKSMTRRCSKVIEAKGGQTKY